MGATAGERTLCDPDRSVGASCHTSGGTMGSPADQRAGGGSVAFTGWRPARSGSCVWRGSVDLRRSSGELRPEARARGTLFKPVER
jgi:hypothetical protein